MDFHSKYLKYKNILLSIHKNKIEQVREMHDKNMTNTSIANELNLRVSIVSDIIRSYKNNRKISMRKLQNDNIENWLENQVSIINNVM